MDEFSDRILVQRVQAGDRGAYEILINRYYRRVYGVCLSIITDPHQSQDLCQDAILKGYMSIHRLREADRFGGWMIEIAKNLCLDWLRRQKQTTTLMEHLADRSDCPQKNDPKDDVAEAVAKLPLELRLPLMMYYFDGRNSHAIGRQLGLSHSTVWRRLQEAKRHLHQLLTEAKNENQTV